MSEQKAPNPGSKAARDIGCRCPVLDNAGGRGAWGSEGPDAVFFVNEDCPVHGKGGAADSGGEAAGEEGER